MARVRDIRHLMALGFTSDNIQLFLPCLDSEDFPERRCEASVQAVARKLAALDGRIAELTAIRGQLQGFLDSAGTPAEEPVQDGPGARDLH